MALWVWIARRLLATRFVSTLRRFTRPLICVFVLQFLTAYSYFILSAVLVQYMSRNLALDDVQASLLYTAFGIMISITGMVFGLMVDQLSVFASVVIGSCVALIARLLFLVVLPIVMTDATWTIGWSVVVLVTLLPFGETAMGQAAGIGIKRYVELDDDDDGGGANARHSNKESHGKEATRSIEYGLSYVLQNAAALLAYASISATRSVMGKHVDEALINRVAIGLSFPALLIAMAVAVLGMYWDTYDIDAAVARREDALLTDDSLREEERKRGQLAGAWGCWERVRPRWMSRLFISGDTGALFVRYLVVSLALTGAKSLFRHQEATMPKYTQRQFSPTYDYAILLSINPAMVIVLTTLVQSWLTHVESLAVITAGTIVCGLGALVFMAPTLSGLYMGVVVFTLGEIVWSPRFTDYVYKLAPEGQEGAFGSVATMPLFLAKIPVGLMSGYLLETYCPAYGHCNGVALWGAIAAFACTSPLLLLAVYRWVTRYTPSRPADSRLIIDVGYDGGHGSSSSMYQLSMSPRSGVSSDESGDDSETNAARRLGRTSTPRKYRPSATPPGFSANATHASGQV